MKAKVAGILILVAVVAIVITLVSVATGQRANDSVAHATSISIQGIDYNFNAAENEWALRVKWVNRPWFEVKANEFWLDKKETTVAEVEARIMEKFNDLLVEDIKISTLEADDRVRQDPPVLLWPDEEIVVINNQDYLRIHRAFFAIHIYSLDDLGTPESELIFLTRFSKYPIPEDWWM